MHPGCGIGIRSVDVGEKFIGIRNRIGILRETGYDLLHLPGGKIDLINRPLHHNEKFIVLIFIDQLSDVGFHDLIRLCGRQECLFLDGVCHTVEVIDPDADFTFVFAAVHIAVYGEIDAARLVNVDDLDVVFVIVFTVVDPFKPTETEHLIQAVVVLIIAPEFSLLDKADHRSVFVGLVSDIPGTDAKLDAVIIEAVVLPTEDLVHGSLKI